MWRTNLAKHEHGDNSISSFLFLLFLLSHTHECKWVTWGGTLPAPPLVNTLTLCDAHVYTALHIYTHAHTCARTMLPSQANRFHSLAQFEEISSICRRRLQILNGFYCLRCRYSICRRWEISYDIHIYVKY